VLVRIVTTRAPEIAVWATSATLTTAAAQVPAGPGRSCAALVLAASLALVTTAVAFRTSLGDVTVDRRWRHGWQHDWGQRSPCGGTNPSRRCGFERGSCPQPHPSGQRLTRWMEEGTHMSRFGGSGQSKLNGAEKAPASSAR